MENTLLQHIKKEPPRAFFDRHFGTETPLRQLAAKIAGLSWADASHAGFTSAQPAPYNLLVNGETGANWLPPTSIVPEGLISWKFQANGFQGPTHKGLSLLFDPFVDAALSVYAHSYTAVFKETVVLILTDYGPLLSFIGELLASQGQDWGALAVMDFLSARNLGTTGVNIVKAVCETDAIGNVQGSTEKLEKAFKRHRLLIWNYFPFFRGGTKGEGVAGLPVDPRWFSYCDAYATEFLNAVNPRRVILACNSEVADKRKAHASASTSHWLSMPHPRSWEHQDRKYFLGLLKD